MKLTRRQLRTLINETINEAQGLEQGFLGASREFLKSAAAKYKITMDPKEILRLLQKDLIDFNKTSYVPNKMGKPPVNLAQFAALIGTFIVAAEGTAEFMEVTNLAPKVGNRVLTWRDLDEIDPEFLLDAALQPLKDFKKYADSTQKALSDEFKDRKSLGGASRFR